MSKVQHRSTFFEMIKTSIIDNSKKENICPSVIAALAAYISNNGNSVIATLAKNIFHLPAVNEENAYISEDGKYRKYSNFNESIQDWVQYLISIKRSTDGPKKYESIIGDFEYKSVADKLVESGFATDYLYTNDSNNFKMNLISIIEDFELYKWDETIKEKLEEFEMSKKKKFSTNPASSNKEVEEIENMYRVRVSWDRPDTQIFASPNANDAIEEAVKHEGYKVFINDDGELYNDPWKKEIVEEEIIDVNAIYAKTIKLPTPGSIVILKNCPVYKLPNSKKAFTVTTGKFYYYDYMVINGRAKITTNPNVSEVNKHPSMIYGYIDI